MDQAERVPLPDLNTTIHQLMAAVHSQEATMQRHEQTLVHQHAEMDRHGTMLREILPAPSPDPAPPVCPAPPAPHHEPRLPTPERYSGDPEECRGFLTQCRLTFDLQLAAYPTDQLIPQVALQRHDVAEGEGPCLGYCTLQG